jgi:hypothetical protein
MDVFLKMSVSTEISPLAIRAAPRVGEEAVVAMLSAQVVPGVLIGRRVGDDGIARRSFSHEAHNGKCRYE